MIALLRWSASTKRELALTYVEMATGIFKPSARMQIPGRNSGKNPPKEGGVGLLRVSTLTRALNKWKEPPFMHLRDVE